MNRHTTQSHLPLSTSTDEEVVEQVRQNNAEDYAEIIKRYQKKLLRYAQYLVNDPALAEDAVQESFIKAFINLNHFNTKKRFSSWIYRIVHNEVMTLVSRQKHTQPAKMIATIADDLDLEDELIRSELITHARECLAKIEILYRVPLLLYFFEEKTYAEISDILRIPISTVGTRIRRAKILVRNICQKK
jgi:RNA polymerase sigma-70 factor (ECF subfamily)